jgi:acetoacetyl-CoA synthetase
VTSAGAVNGATDDVLWQPSQERRERAEITRFTAWLAQHRGLNFAGYEALWRWSTSDLDGFWRAIWDYHEVGGRAAPARILIESRMPGSRWCPDERLNYAEHLLRHGDDARGPAIISVGEDTPAQELPWAQLRARAGALAATLRDVGVGPGDRVVGYLAHTPDPIIALIACASIGAIWSVCAPDYGAGGVLSRFAQLEPTVLIATTGYHFAGRVRDRRREAAQIIDGLPTLRCVISASAPPELEPLGAQRVPVISWEAATAAEQPLHFEQLPFEHPLWVLFSSGTTGRPKGVVHSHGGMLLEGLKVATAGDVRAGERQMYLASTSWMVWNVLVSNMLVGASVVLLDGSPFAPQRSRVWDVVAELRVATLGVGAGYLHECAKTGLQPGRTLDLGNLRCIISTGSPLMPSAYAWVYDAVSADVWLACVSGGTDVCTAFITGSLLLPVRAGRMQAPALGVAVAAWNAAGEPVIGEVGELVVTEPMPSMPLGLWHDDDGSRYRDSYFSTYPGVWRHGDALEFDADLSSVIHGRSDATLNRRGVRIGSAEIYGAVEPLDAVIEALVVGVEQPDGGYYMPLYVKLVDGMELDDVAPQIDAAIRDALSPRHVPDEVIAVPGIPHTRTGKKLELPVKRLLMGAPLDSAADRGSVDDPELLEWFARHAAERTARTAVSGV